jgi:hypothetical protein
MFRRFRRPRPKEEEPTLHRVFFAAGAALFFTQLVERLLRLLFEKVLDSGIMPRKEIPKPEEILKMARKGRPPTLGSFFVKLRKHYHVEQGFDDKLQKFLSKRNTFIHHPEKFDGWDMETTKGRTIAYDIASRLCDEAQEIAKMLLALGILEEADIKLLLPTSEFFADLEANYAHKAKRVFRRK